MATHIHVVTDKTDILYGTMIHNTVACLTHLNFQTKLIWFENRKKLFFVTL